MIKRRQSITATGYIFLIILKLVQLKFTRIHCLVIQYIWNQYVDSLSHYIQPVYSHDKVLIYNDIIWNSLHGDVNSYSQSHLALHYIRNSSNQPYLVSVINIALIMSLHQC